MTVDPILLEADEQLAIDGALEALEAGGVVVFPTDTVYGLLASTDHPTAYQRIFELKQRDPVKPIALLAGHNSLLATNMVRALSMHQLELTEFQTGAATLVVNPGELPPGSIPASVSDCQPGPVGIRIPAHNALQQLLEELCGLVWATSVNPAGDQPAVTTDEVVTAVDSLAGAVDYIVASRALSRGWPSRVLLLEQGLITERPR